MLRFTSAGALVAVTLVARMAVAEERAPDAAATVALDNTLNSRLRGPIDRELVVRAALANHPALRASERRAEALREQADAQAQLPAPELMAEIWQVPIKRPYAIGDAGMVMLGFRQAIPAPGSLGARAEARRHEARARSMMGRVTAREIRRDVSHAFVDYAQAFASSDVHREHSRVLERLHHIAEARIAGGAMLADTLEADAELALVHADLAADSAAIDTGRARLNALLRRPATAELGAPQQSSRFAELGGPESVSLAVRARPERSALLAERDARRAELRAREQEATWPAFTVAGLYFAPTGGMTEHGYGVSAAMSLPWLWGGAGHERAAERAALKAAELDSTSSDADIARDVTAAIATARSAEVRLRTLQARVVPALERAAQAVRAGYESGSSSLSRVLQAQQRLVDVHMEIVRARTAYEHALVDLEWALGQRLSPEKHPHSERKQDHE